MTNLKHEFWDRMDNVQAAMLGIRGDGGLVPMSPTVDEDVPDHVWFITAHGTHLVDKTADGPQPARLVVADGASGIYADVDGTLAQVTDKKALDEVWSVVASAWFEEGKTDPDVCLLRFSPASAEVWITPTSGARFLYEVAKGNLTGAEPDMGESGAVTFG